MPGKYVQLGLNIHFRLQFLTVGRIKLLNPERIRTVGQEKGTIIFILLLLYEDYIVAVVIAEGCGCVVQDCIQEGLGLGL